MKVITRLFLVITLGLSLSFSIYVSADDFTGCGSETPKITLDSSIENNFDFGKSNDVVLLEGTCSQLKSGACGTGTCEKGWKCMDTGVQCLCSPPQ